MGTHGQSKRTKTGAKAYLNKKKKFNYKKAGKNAAIIIGVILAIAAIAGLCIWLAREDYGPVVYEGWTHTEIDGVSDTSAPYDPVEEWTYDGVERAAEGRWASNFLPPCFPQRIKVNSVERTEYFSEYLGDIQENTEGFPCWLLTLKVSTKQWKNLDKAFENLGWTGEGCDIDKYTQNLSASWYNKKYVTTVYQSYRTFDFKSSEWEDEFTVVLMVREMGEYTFPEVLTEFFPVVDAYSFSDLAYKAYVSEDDSQGTTVFTGELDPYWLITLKFDAVTDEAFAKVLSDLEEAGYPVVESMTDSDIEEATNKAFYYKCQEPEDENGFAHGVYLEYYPEYGILNAAYYNYEIILGE